MKFKYNNGIFAFFEQTSGEIKCLCRTCIPVTSEIESVYENISFDTGEFNEGVGSFFKFKFSEVKCGTVFDILEFSELQAA